jgi:hypothetical protein
MRNVESRSRLAGLEVTAAEDPEAEALLPAPGTAAGTITASRKQQLQVLLRLAGMCCCWLTASSGIIIVNRRIMRELQFAYPMALSALGQGSSFLCAWIVCDRLKLVPPVDKSVDRRFYWARIVPLGAAQVGHPAHYSWLWVQMRTVGAYIE